MEHLNDVYLCMISADCSILVTVSKYDRSIILWKVKNFDMVANKNGKKKLKTVENWKDDKFELIILLFISLYFWWNLLTIKRQKIHAFLSNKCLHAYMHTCIHAYMYICIWYLILFIVLINSTPFIICNPSIVNFAIQQCKQKRRYPKL